MPSQSPGDAVARSLVMHFLDMQLRKGMAIFPNGSS